MHIDSNTIVSITEANQNFSKVARLTDECGTVVILKNNRPKYILSCITDDGVTHADADVSVTEEIKTPIAPAKKKRVGKKAVSKNKADKAAGSPTASTKTDEVRTTPGRDMNDFLL